MSTARAALVQKFVSEMGRLGHIRYYMSPECIAPQLSGSLKDDGVTYCPLQRPGVVQTGRLHQPYRRQRRSAHRHTKTLSCSKLMSLFVLDEESRILSMNRICYLREYSASDTIVSGRNKAFPSALLASLSSSTLSSSHCRRATHPSRECVHTRSRATTD